MSMGPRTRRLVTRVLVLELAGVLLFCVALFVGESTHPTTLALYAPRQPLIVATLAGLVLARWADRRVRVLQAAHLVLSLVVLFPVMGMEVGTSRKSDRAIHLATYNVFFGKEGRPALVKELASMPADILVVQAAFGSLGDRLREAMPGRNIKQEGELICASKFPIRAFEVPPELPDGTAPMFVKCVVDTPQGALRVYDVHAYSPRHALFGDEDSDRNATQRTEQIQGVVSAARSDVPPFVIAGDTNLPVLSSIARRHFAGLSDAFADVGFGFGYSFPAKKPWMRIDRVLGSDGVRFLDAHVADRGASDHRALYVDLELTDAR